MIANKLLSLHTGNLTWGGLNYRKAMMLHRFGRCWTYVNESLSIASELPFIKARQLFSEAKLKFETNVFLN